MLQLQQLHGSWAMVAVLDFLTTFHAIDGLAGLRNFSALDLERALIRSPGGPGLLADVHAVRPLLSCGAASCLLDWVQRQPELAGCRWLVGLLLGRGSLQHPLPVH